MKYIIVKEKQGDVNSGHLKIISNVVEETYSTDRICALRLLCRYSAKE